VQVILKRSIGFEFQRVDIGISGGAVENAAAEDRRSGERLAEQDGDNQ